MKTRFRLKLLLAIRFLCVFFSLGCLSFINAQNSNWQAVVSPGANWMYTTPNYQLPNNWNQQGFDDSSWSEGPSGIG